MSRRPSIGILACILLACGRGERQADREGGPRPDTSLHSPRQEVMTGAGGAAMTGQDFFAGFQEVYGLDSAGRAALGDSALAALDRQPLDAYDSLARELDLARDTAEIAVPVTGDEERPLAAVPTLGGELAPGSRLAFSFLGTEYRLAATIRPPHRSPEGHILTTKDYRLFLTAVRDGREVTQMILHIDGLDDKVPGLGFAGDVDGDGRLELILDDSGHYNAGAASLYLSRPAAGGALLRRAGTHLSVGC